MKIEQSLFEELIEKVLRGEINRKEISKKYQIGERTVNARITELSEKNPDLYERFIAKYPFRPKKITNINYINLIKRMIKEKIPISKIEEEYEISRRTLLRRVNELKNSDEIEEQSGLKYKELFKLYKNYQRGELTNEDMNIISNFTYNEIKEKEIYEDREEFLMQLLDSYYTYIRQGTSKAEAARRLGFEYADMYKKEEELKRIQKEKETRKTFTERIKYEVKPTTHISKQNKAETIINEKGRE